MFSCYFGKTSTDVRKAKTHSLRLEGIIRRAYEQTGQQVVVLVDEYDAPMLDSKDVYKRQSFNTLWEPFTNMPSTSSLRVSTFS